MEMESRLNQIPGVLTVGIFAQRAADVLLIAQVRMAFGKCASDQESGLLEIIYFTLVAALLYLLCQLDPVDRMEVAAGRRFQYRSVLFFGILLTLALISFYLIRLYTGNP